jgi:hypothetical protein
MINNPVTQNQQAASIENMQIKMPDFFDSGRKYIPIGEQTNVNGKNIPAIPNFTQLPNDGNYVAVIIDGALGFTQLPNDGNYVAVVIDGSLGFVKANQGQLQLFNNSLGWTDTEACE